MSTNPNRFVLKEKKVKESKVVDFLSLFRERYGKDPVFASKTNYLANEQAKVELAVIHPDSSFAKLFKGRIPSVDDLLGVEIDSCNNVNAYLPQDKTVVEKDEVKNVMPEYESEVAHTQDFFNIPPISYGVQRRDCSREERPNNYRNMRPLEARLGGEVYYARGRGISYRRAS